MYLRDIPAGFSGGKAACMAVVDGDGFSKCRYYQASGISGEGLQRHWPAHDATTKHGGQALQSQLASPLCGRSC